jgi:hypothetical protein
MLLIGSLASRPAVRNCSFRQPAAQVTKAVREELPEPGGRLASDLLQDARD